MGYGGSNVFVPFQKHPYIPVGRVFFLGNSLLELDRDQRGWEGSIRFVGGLFVLSQVCSLANNGVDQGKDMMCVDGQMTRDSWVVMMMEMGEIWVPSTDKRYDGSKDLFRMSRPILDGDLLMRYGSCIVA